MLADNYIISPARYWIFAWPRTTAGVTEVYEYKAEHKDAPSLLSVATDEHYGYVGLSIVFKTRRSRLRTRTSMRHAAIARNGTADRHRTGRAKRTKGYLNGLWTVLCLHGLYRAYRYRMYEG